MAPKGGVDHREDIKGTQRSMVTVASECAVGWGRLPRGGWGSWQAVPAGSAPAPAPAAGLLTDGAARQSVGGSRMVIIMMG